MFFFFSFFFLLFFFLHFFFFLFFLLMLLFTFAFLPCLCHDDPHFESFTYFHPKIKIKKIGRYKRGMYFFIFFGDFGKVQSLFQSAFRSKDAMLLLLSSSSSLSSPSVVKQRKIVLIGTCPMDVHPGQVSFSHLVVHCLQPFTPLDLDRARPGQLQCLQLHLL